jgi:hypothetical protein
MEEEEEKKYHEMITKRRQHILLLFLTLVYGNTLPSLVDLIPNIASNYIHQVMG